MIRHYSKSSRNSGLEGALSHSEGTPLWGGGNVWGVTSQRLVNREVWVRGLLSQQWQTYPPNPISGFMAHPLNYVLLLNPLYALRFSYTKTPSSQTEEINSNIKRKIKLCFSISMTILGSSFSSLLRQLTDTTNLITHFRASKVLNFPKDFLSKRTTCGKSMKKQEWEEKQC